MNQGYPYLYIHLPFCDVICHYCDFYTARAKNADHDRLLRAVGADLNRQRDRLAPSLKAVYFGGGTPGETPPHLIHRFLDQLRERISADTEVTLEANPNNIAKETVRAWKAAGVNRISVGVQSLRDQLLKKLGRTHSAKGAIRALEICVSEIPNVTGDLIYGVPEQSIDDPAVDAAAMAEVGLKHLSAYHLSLEASHFLHSKLPTSDHAFQQIDRLQESLARRGFEHYEISNFAQRGYESKNNSNYWVGGPYMALGPSAHGFDGHSRRWQNIADWQEYARRLEAGISPVSTEEGLSREQLSIEALFTGLRIKPGLHLTRFLERFGIDLRITKAQQLEEIEKTGLGHVTNDHLVLTFRGRMLADEIARKLL